MIGAEQNQAFSSERAPYQEHSSGSTDIRFQSGFHSDDLNGSESLQRMAPARKIVVLYLDDIARRLLCFRTLGEAQFRVRLWTSSKIQLRGGLIAVRSTSSSCSRATQTISPSHPINPHLPSTTPEDRRTRYAQSTKTKPSALEAVGRITSIRPRAAPSRDLYQVV